MALYGFVEENGKHGYINLKYEEHRVERGRPQTEGGQQ
jgi:hypothetical protein